MERNRPIEKRHRPALENEKWGPRFSLRHYLTSRSHGYTTGAMDRCQALAMDRCQGLIQPIPT